MNITLIITMLTIIIAASTSISMGKELKERKKKTRENQVRSRGLLIDSLVAEHLWSHYV